MRKAFEYLKQVGRKSKEYSEFFHRARKETSGESRFGVLSVFKTAWNHKFKIVGLGSLYYLYSKLFIVRPLPEQFFLEANKDSLKNLYLNFLSLKKKDML